MRILYILSTALTFMFFSGCDKIMPDLKRDNPNDLRDGSSKITIKEVDILSGNGMVTVATPGSTIYINVVIIHYGENSAIIQNIKGAFNSNTTILSDIVPAFGTPVSFYRNVATKETDLKIGQTAYAVAFPQSYSTYAFRAKIGSNARHGEEIKFTVQLSDDTNRTWTEDFKIVVN